MKTLDWSVETLGLDYNSTGLCNYLFKPDNCFNLYYYAFLTRSANEKNADIADISRNCIVGSVKNFRAHLFCFALI